MSIPCDVHIGCFWCLNGAAARTRGQTACRRSTDDTSRRWLPLIVDFCCPCSLLIILCLVPLCFCCFIICATLRHWRTLPSSQAGLLTIQVEQLRETIASLSAIIEHQKDEVHPLRAPHVQERDGARRRAAADTTAAQGQREELDVRGSSAHFFECNIPNLLTDITFITFYSL